MVNIRLRRISRVRASTTYLQLTHNCALAAFAEISISCGAVEQTTNELSAREGDSAYYESPTIGPSWT